MSSDIPRLSDQNITDDIMRSHFYSVITDYLSDTDAELSDYTIKTDEAYRPDLASYRHYGTKELDWLIMLVSDVIDPADPLTIGEKLSLPTSSWVRRTMRQFMNDYGIE